MADNTVKMSLESAEIRNWHRINSIHMPLQTRTMRLEQTIWWENPNHLGILPLENSSNLSVSGENEVFQSRLICRETRPIKFLAPPLKNTVTRRRIQAGNARNLCCCCKSNMYVWRKVDVASEVRSKRKAWLQVPFQPALLLIRDFWRYSTSRSLTLEVGDWGLRVILWARYIFTIIQISHGQLPRTEWERKFTLIIT